MTEPITIPTETYDELLARYPWIGSRDPYAYLSRGWVDLLVAMLDGMDAVMADHPGASVEGWYTKEKFGCLVVYFRIAGRPDAAAVLTALRTPLDAAERASSVTCEVCGANGRLRKARGWLSTRCDDHVDGS